MSPCSQKLDKAVKACLEQTLLPHWWRGQRTFWTGKPFQPSQYLFICKWNYLSALILLRSGLIGK